MIVKATTLLLLFRCCQVWAQVDNACCGGRNLITVEKKCLDGEMRKLSCDSLIMVYANDSEMSVDVKGNLMYVDSDEFISPNQYCVSKLQKNNRDIYTICYEEEPQDVRIINVTLSFVSVFFIILTICVYMMVPQLLDTQGICLMQSITGLGLSFILLGVINLTQFIPHHHCRLIAYLMYFSFLYAFFWLNILCFHIWKMIVNPQILRSIKRWKMIYHIVGVGGSLLLLLFVLTANYSGYEFFNGIHPGIGDAKCWFKDSTTTFIYFYGPISVLLCINIVYFVWTTMVLCEQMKRCSEKTAKVQKFRLLLCIKLFFVMGISWIFEVVSALFEENTSRWIWVIPDALNALQGFLIFLILVVFRKKVVRALANKKIFNAVRLPAKWKNAQDDECEELEEELSLSAVYEKNEKKADIPA
ncbi:G-protein coupled receptor Mth2 [Anoplophora glabripennis]|uniref:G-protein coupled receptor n=1 Tax=Anoplophora glabripennis TaxID=217634 RepID=V5I9E6_ANOGL|nr:G-protein coupled receptor Mth2 [Anoplophora glabripennis]